MTGVLDAARSAYLAGLSVVPPREDGSKRPVGAWVRYRSERATSEQVHAWYVEEERSGLGAVMGAVSGHVEMFEIEGDAVAAGELDEAVERFKAAGVLDIFDKIRDGYEEETPSGGRHWLVRTEQAGATKKLANRPISGPEIDSALNREVASDSSDAEWQELRAMIARRPMTKWEAKSEGGFTILAPSNGSVHPNGGMWTISRGGFATIATVTVEERDAVYSVIRTFDTMPIPTAKRPVSSPSQKSNGDGPADVYNADPDAQSNVLRILKGHGWKLLYAKGDEMGLRRPGKQGGGISATLGHFQDPPMLRVFSTSTVFDVSRGYTPFQVYAELEHSGDWSKAARRLVDDGYGVGRDGDDEARFNDSANSTRLIRLHGDHLRYVLVWKKWIAWGKHAWSLDGGDVRVREIAKDVGSALYQQAGDENDPDTAKKTGAWAARSASRSGIEGMVHLARGIDGVPIRHDELDVDPWLFGVQNGVVDLRTGMHRPGDPADLMHRQAGAGSDAAAGCPLWEQCMVEWFPDEETRRYVQRLAGSALVGKQKDHLFIIHYGVGGNGKGTFMRAVAHVMGDYFMTPDKSLIVTERHQKHDTERAALFRIRLAVAAETDKRQKLNEAQIKNLTGGDPIHARRLYEDPWEFAPSHSMWLQTNYLPEIQGRDGGIWRRIRVVPWVVTFDGARQDTDLDDKLAGEAAGILNWLIAGCLDWQRDGLNEPANVVAATADYRASEDILQRFAEATGLTFKQDLEVTAKDLGDSITEWSQDEGLTRSPSVGERADWLKSRGASKRRVTREQKKATVWFGVGFDTIDEDPYDPTNRERPTDEADTLDTPIQETPREATPQGSHRNGVPGVSTSTGNRDAGAASAFGPSVVAGAVSASSDLSADQVEDASILHAGEGTLSPTQSCSCGLEAVDTTPTGIPVCAVHLVTEMLDGSDVTATQPSSEAVAGERLAAEWNDTPYPGASGSPYCRCGLPATSKNSADYPVCQRHRTR